MNPRWSRFCASFLMWGALLAALGGFTTIVVGWRWWIIVAGITGLGTLVGALVRLWHSAAGWLAEAVTMVVLASWYFARETTLAFLLTPETVRTFGTLLRQAQSDIMSEQAPMAANDAVTFVFVTWFCVVLCALEVLLPRLTGVGLVAIVLVSIHVAPGLITGEPPPWWSFAIPATLFVMLWAMPRADRNTPLPAVFGAGVLAVVGAVVASLFVPQTSGWTSGWRGEPSALFDHGINPMIDLGANLRRGSDRVALEYSNDVDEPVYLKVATLSDFSGEQWEPGEPSEDEIVETDTFLDQSIPTEVVATEIRIEALRSAMLPVPYPVEGLFGVGAGWNVRDGGGTISHDDAMTKQGMRYVAMERRRQATAAQMRRMPARVPNGSRGGYDRDAIERAFVSSTDLPDAVPAVIERTARRVTSRADNDYDRVRLLQRWFRNRFSYSESAPVNEGYDGSGLAVMEEFLAAREGYCVHFSSTMAVMARSLGMPARVAVGYAPGESTGRSNSEGHVIRQVSSHDLHAWTEVFFDGVGWVAFDPTPGIGSATTFLGDPASVTDDPDDDIDDQPARPTPEPSDAVPSEQPDQATAPGEVTTPSAETTSHRWWLGGALIALLVMGLTTPRWLRRRIARRRLTSGDPATLWAEVSATARDYGIELTATKTIRSQLEELRDARPSIGIDLIERCISQWERDLYGPPRAVIIDDLAPLAEELVATIHDGASPRHRTVATWFPASVFRRQ